MAGGLEISGDLQEWASTAGFSLTPTDLYGRAVFSSSDSEIRYFIGAGNDGWLRVTSSNRMGPEQLELAAPLLLTIETYFYGSFGWDVRYYNNFPRATVVDRLPGRFEVRSLADDAGQDYLAGFNAANRDYLARFDQPNQDYPARFNEPNRDYLVLIDAQSGPTAIDGSGEVLARIRLANLAVYLSHDTEEIKASFLARDGASLLAVTEG